MALWVFWPFYGFMAIYNCIVNFVLKCTQTNNKPKTGKPDQNGEIRITRERKNGQQIINYAKT